MVKRMINQTKAVPQPEAPAIPQENLQSIKLVASPGVPVVTKEAVTEKPQVYQLEILKKELLQNQQIIKALTQERDYYRKLHDRHILQRDIGKIRAAYPHEISGDCKELGEVFYSLMATGSLSPIEAYNICNHRKGKNVPPTMGDVATATGNDLYTRSQVEKMSQNEVDRNYVKILKSMEHWR